MTGRYTGRYSVRKAIEGRASILCEGLAGDGRILDLSVPGCLLETGLQLQVGQAVQLCLTCATGTSLHIALAVVRWVNGRKAGLELIRMSETDQARLRYLVGFFDKRRTTRAWTEHVMWTGISGV